MRGRRQKGQDSFVTVSLRREHAKLQQEIVLSKWRTYRNFLSKLDFRKDGVKAHRFVSSLNNDGGNKAMEPLIVGGRNVSSPKDVANTLCTYYARISRLHVPREAVKRINKLPPALCLGKREHDLMNDDFKMEEFKAALVTFKAGKSAGPDGIFPEFLLNMGHEAGKTFLKLANLTWKKGLPDQWQKSEIIPILIKGKSPTAAESYRPVSLTSVCCKLTERMVAERLRNHLENEGRIKEEQAGFRKHRSRPGPGHEVHTGSEGWLSSKNVHGRSPCRLQSCI
jgi:hypothetical protein